MANPLPLALACFDGCHGLRQFFWQRATSILKTELIGRQFFSSFDTDRTSGVSAPESAASATIPPDVRGRFNCGRFASSIKKRKGNFYPAAAGYKDCRRLIKGDFGATKMRFDEGDERAARVSYELPASSYPRSGRAEERSRAAAGSRKRIYLPV
jgi:hypothetical protein